MIHYYEDGRNELYNLNNDLEESNDVSNEYLSVVSELHKTLFEYLKNVGAKYPVKDSLYNSEMQMQYLNIVSTKKMQELEEKRMEFLSPDFNPKNNWWGSSLTID